MFRDISAYMGAVVCRITTPRFERLDIRFFKQLTVYLPRLLQFMDTTNNLRFSAAELKFSDENADVQYALSIAVCC